jgi:hypothetical protein
MEMSGHRHVTSGDSLRYPLKKGAGWVPQPICTLREKFMSFCCSLGAIQTANTDVHCKLRKLGKPSHIKGQGLPPEILEPHKQESGRSASSNTFWIREPMIQTTCWRSNGKSVLTTWNNRTIISKHVSSIEVTSNGEQFLQIYRQPAQAVDVTVML